MPLDGRREVFLICSGVVWPSGLPCFGWVWMWNETAGEAGGGRPPRRPRFFGVGAAGLSRTGARPKSPGPTIPQSNTHVTQPGARAAYARDFLPRRKNLPGVTSRHRDRYQGQLHWDTAPGTPHPPQPTPCPPRNRARSVIVCLCEGQIWFASARLPSQSLSFQRKHRDRQNPGVTATIKFSETQLKKALIK